LQRDARLMFIGLWNLADDEGVVCGDASAIKSELFPFDERLRLKTVEAWDFCSSINVLRNMNEDQMIEAAAMLIAECGNFRLEDYVMMFSMGVNATVE
jgi:hypothetical protein